MTFSAYEKLFLNAALVLGLLTVIVTDEIDAVFWAIPLVALVAAIVNERLRREPLLPSGTLPTVLAVGFGVFDMAFLAENYLVAVVDLVLLLFAIKLLGARTVRDNLQLIGLSFLLVLGSSVMAAEAAFGFALLTYMFLVLTALVMQNLRGHWESSGGETSVLARSRGVLGNAFGLTVFLLGCGILVFTLVVYFAFPRVGLRLWQTDLGRESRVSGFSDRVELGSVGRIQTNSAVALRVAYEDGDVPAEDDPRRKLRGVVLDRFDGTSWEATQSDLKAVTGGGRYWHLHMGRPTERIEISPSSDYAGVLFLPLGALTVHGDFHSIQRSTEGNYKIDRRDGGRLSYEVGVAEAKPSDPIEDPRYLQLPDNFSPRVTELTRQWGDGATGETLAASLTKQLRTTFDYSTDLDEQNDYSIEQFLFVDRAGHCELFATSLAVMLRAEGIPTRLVNGFAFGERWDDESVVFRESHAHSWVEAYFPKKGWIEFDPTPPSAQEWGLLKKVSLSYHSAIAAVRFFWGKWFVDYDYDRQRRMARDFRRASERVGSQLSVSGVRKWFAEKDWGSLGQGAAAAGGFLLIVGGVIAYWRRSARAVLRKSKLSKLYEKRMRMAERVEPRRRGLTPLAFSLRVAVHDGWRDFVDYTKLYYKLRYGEASPEDGIRFLELDRRLGKRRT